MGKIDKLKIQLGGAILKIRIKTREKLNPYLAPLRRMRLKHREFTIISNNCWAGHVYRYFGIPYLTPTVGLYFFADDYIRFLKNLKYYMNIDLKFIPLSKSKHKDELYEHGGKSITCPIGVLDDIEIIFLHYKTEAEAYGKWNRRKSRIVWERLFIKMSQMNGCTKFIMDEYDRLPFENKFLFVKEPMDYDTEIVFHGYEKADEITNDTNDFRKYINLRNWINGKPCKKNQKKAR